MIQLSCGSIGCRQHLHWFCPGGVLKSATLASSRGTPSFAWPLRLLRQLCQHTSLCLPPGPTLATCRPLPATLCPPVEDHTSGAILHKISCKEILLSLLLPLNSSLSWIGHVLLHRHLHQHPCKSSCYLLPPPPCLQKTTPWVAIYFFIAIFIGMFVLLQLFLAILLSNLHSVSMGCVSCCVSCVLAKVGWGGSRWLQQLQLFLAVC